MTIDIHTDIANIDDIKYFPSGSKITFSVKGGTYTARCTDPKGDIVRIFVPQRYFDGESSHYTPDIRTCISRIAHKELFGQPPPQDNDLVEYLFTKAKETKPIIVSSDRFTEDLRPYVKEYIEWYDKEEERYNNSWVKRTEALKKGTRER